MFSGVSVPAVLVAVCLTSASFNAFCTPLRTSAAVGGTL